MEIPEALQGRVVVDIPTAAKVLGIDRNTAYQAARDGQIPHIRVGRLFRVPVSKLLELLGLTDQTPAA